MKQRIITALLLIATVIPILWFGGPLLYIALTLLSALAVYEILKNVYPKIDWWGYFALLIIVVVLTYCDKENFIYYLGYDNFNNLNTLEKVYALCKGSNSLLVFNVDRDTFDLTYIGKEDLFDFSPTNGVLSKDNKTLILTGENEKCIKICKIHQ